MFIKSSAGISSHITLVTYEEGYILPVLTREELLFGHRHRGLLRLFKDLSGLNDEDYDRSYAQLLHNFMEFVQVLPHKTNGILGSLLNYSLARACSVFQKYCLAKKENTTPLLKFAVFSAALLKDLGRVVSNQRVVLVDEKGDFIADWNPFTGPMLGQASHYKMYPIGASYLRLESTVLPMLARQIMPEEMFLWLSSDSLLFSDWLAALLGEEGVGSRELTLALLFAKREDIIEILSTLEGAEVTMQPPDENDFAESFYRWLKAGIEDGSIAVNTNDANVQIVSQGVLLQKQLFKQFADFAKLPVNYLLVYQQVCNYFGVAKKSGADFLHANYFSQADAHLSSYATFASAKTQKQQTHEGVVVDPQLIFLKKENPGLSSLKSATALVSVLHQSPQKIALQNMLNTRMK